MRVLKAIVAWSGAGSGAVLLHSQAIGAFKPRITACLVDRGFCPQSIYGIRTYDHKYTLKLANSDGALDRYRTLWMTDQAVFSVYAADDSTFAGTTWATDAGTTDLKFARHITRVIVTFSEVIIEADGGSIREFLDVRLAQLYSTLYNTFTQNKPQLWAAGRVTVDVDALQIVGSTTDFDAGSRTADVDRFFVNGTLTGVSAPAGAGEFSVSTATVDGKRTAAIIYQPNSSGPSTAKDAFDSIMLQAGFVAGTSYVDSWSRGTLDSDAYIGVSAREETRLETIEKIIAGYDAGLTERSDGQIAVVCLQDFYAYTTATPAYDLTSREIDRIEVENAPFDGLGKFIAWNQNDAVHSASDSKIADPYNLQAPAEQHDSGTTFAPVYETNEDVKKRTFQTWFNDNGAFAVALAEQHLEDFYAAENMIVTIAAPGFDLQELNPGDKVSLTHERFDLGVMPNKFQLLNLRYDLMLLSVTMQLIGKKRS